MPMGHRKPTGQQIRQSSKVNETFPQNKPKYLQYSWVSMGFLRVFHVFVSIFFSKTRHHKLNVSPVFVPHVLFSMIFHVYPKHFGPVLQRRMVKRQVSRPLGWWHRSRRPARSGGLGAAFALDGAQTSGGRCFAKAKLAKNQPLDPSGKHIKSY